MWPPRQVVPRAPLGHKTNHLPSRSRGSFLPPRSSPGGLARQAGLQHPSKRWSLDPFTNCLKGKAAVHGGQGPGTPRLAQPDGTKGSKASSLPPPPHCPPPPAPRLQARTRPSLLVRKAALPAPVPPWTAHPGLCPSPAGSHAPASGPRHSLAEARHLPHPALLSDPCPFSLALFLSGRGLLSPRHPRTGSDRPSQAAHGRGAGVYTAQIHPPLDKQPGWPGIRAGGWGLRETLPGVGAEGGQPGERPEGESPRPSPMQGRGVTGAACGSPWGN